MTKSGCEFNTLISQQKEARVYENFGSNII